MLLFPSASTVQLTTAVGPDESSNLIEYRNIQKRLKLYLQGSHRSPQLLRYRLIVAKVFWTDSLADFGVLHVSNGTPNNDDNRSRCSGNMSYP